MVLFHEEVPLRDETGLSLVAHIFSMQVFNIYLSRMLVSCSSITVGHVCNHPEIFRIWLVPKHVFIKDIIINLHVATALDLLGVSRLPVINILPLSLIDGSLA